MSREEIYALAATAPKGDWGTYNKLKGLLTEKLSVVAHFTFCNRLAEILEV